MAQKNSIIIKRTIMKPNTTTLAIKAKVYNKIRTFLYKKNLERFTILDKAMFFDVLFKDNTETHKLLNNYKSDRKYKAKIRKEREERGIKPRKKISKEQYEIQLRKAS